MSMVNNGDIVRFEVPRDFAIKEAGEFRELAYEAINKGSADFVLDFRECEFIDSSGLGVMVSVFKRCMDKNGSFKVKNLKPQVLKLFQLTRLDKVFDII